jgi:hypothetical protein
MVFMISLSQAKPGMVRRGGWAGAIVRVCLEGMGELSNNNLNVCLEADICPAEFFCCLILTDLDQLIACRKSNEQLISTSI